jgi:hypothetical protein
MPILSNIGSPLEVSSGCNAEDSLDGQPGCGMKQAYYMARTANFDITNI